MLFHLSLVILVHCFFSPDSGVVFFHFSLLVISILQIDESIHDLIVGGRTLFGLDEDIGFSENL
jgi:hypothetical protein